MMTKDEVMAQLAKYGSASTKKTLMNHGAREPFYGVKIGDMKVLQKKIKKDYELSLELFDTGNSDAMYFAGLIADESKMTKKDLNHWMKGAYWHMISEYTVPWIAAESKHGLELGLEWIDSKEDRVASAGWSTLSSYLSITPDDKIDVKQFEKLLDRIVKNIKTAGNRTRYAMNGFLLAAGCFAVPLSAKAKEAAKKIGEVTVDMGGTACKVPDAASYIDKVAKMGRVGKKKKMARC